VGAAKTRDKVTTYDARKDLGERERGAAEIAEYNRKLFKVRLEGF
jgi:hypothetical protein